MKHEKRSKWSSQATFILAAIGSAEIGRASCRERV